MPIPIIPSLSRPGLAIDAAAGVVSDPAQKQAPAFAFTKPLDERTRNCVQPGSQDVFSDLVRQVLVDRMNEPIEIEIKDEHVRRPDIFGCCEADGTEAVPHGRGQDRTARRPDPEDLWLREGQGQ